MRSLPFVSPRLKTFFCIGEKKKVSDIKKILQKMNNICHVIKKQEKTSKDVTQNLRDAFGP